MAEWPRAGACTRGGSGILPTTWCMLCNLEFATAGQINTIEGGSLLYNEILEEGIQASPDLTPMHLSGQLRFPLGVGGRKREVGGAAPLHADAADTISVCVCVSVSVSVTVTDPMMSVCLCLCLCLCLHDIQAHAGESSSAPRNSLVPPGAPIVGMHILVHMPSTWSMHTSHASHV